MNKEQRNYIDIIITKLDNIKILINAIGDEERENLNNLPYKYSTHAERMQEAIYNLDCARHSVDTIQNYLYEAQNS